MKKLLLVLVIILFGNTSLALECKKYDDFSQDKMITATKTEVQEFMECALDKKISPMNREFKFDGQEKYWDNIYFLLEHAYDNSGETDKFAKTLPGKYNTMNKLEMAILREKTLQELGANATGYYFNLGPVLVNWKYPWDEYYTEVTQKYSPIKNMSESEQKAFIKDLNSQIKYFINKGSFKSSYVFNVYVMNLLGILYNIEQKDLRKDLAYNIVTLYNSTESDFEISKYVDKALYIK